MREVLTGPCEATSTLTGENCGESFARLYAGACVHEHVTERRLCERDATRDNLWCRACFELDEAKTHKCHVTLIHVAEAVAGTEGP